MIQFKIFFEGGGKPKIFLSKNEISKFKKKYRNIHRFNQFIFISSKISIHTTTPLLSCFHTPMSPMVSHHLSLNPPQNPM